MSNLISALKVLLIKNLVLVFHVFLMTLDLIFVAMSFELSLIALVLDLKIEIRC